MRHIAMHATTAVFDGAVPAACDVRSACARRSSQVRWRRTFRAVLSGGPEIQVNRAGRRAYGVRLLPPIHVRRSSRVRADGGVEKPAVTNLPARFRLSRAAIRPPSGGERRGLGLVALYARFSTNKQKYASIEIQLERARDVARKLGFKIYREYSEAARSGTNVEYRNVFQDMMKDALSGCFQTIIVYNVSRFSRTWREAMDKFDELSDVGVTVQALDHELDEDAFLEEARRADKNHKGLLNDMHDGRMNTANSGRRPLGPAFGHKITPGEPGVHTKHVKHAATVRMIFRLLDNGYGATTVAHILTKKGRATPKDAQIEAHNRRNPKDPKPRAEAGHRMAWATSFPIWNRAIITILSNGPEPNPGQADGSDSMGSRTSRSANMGPLLQIRRILPPSVHGRDSATSTVICAARWYPRRWILVDLELCHEQNVQAPNSSAT